MLAILDVCRSRSVARSGSSGSVGSSGVQQLLVQVAEPWDAAGGRTMRWTEPPHHTILNRIKLQESKEDTE